MVLEYDSLRGLKNLWRPGPIPEVSGAATRTKLARHDAHNLELKVFYDAPNPGKKISLDLYLFMPASLHLGICEKTDLIRDFHSRLRLTEAGGAARGSVDADIQTLRLEIERWSTDLDFDERASSNERIFSLGRHVGAVLGEELKAKASRQSKAIFLPHSLASMLTNPSQVLLGLVDDIQETQLQVREVRTLVRSAPDAFPALLLLDQYLSLQYVDYLSRLRETLDKFEYSTDGHRQLRETLDRLQSDEAREGQHPDATADPELEALHMSRLKKFFQSELFMDVTQRQALKRVAEPMAALAALSAGGMVGFLEHAMKLSGWMLSLHGIVAVFLGMTLYALKDRLKDRGRTILTKALAKRFPDIERELLVGGKVMGKIGEWYSLIKISRVPERVREARFRSCISAIERHLPEEILHFHKLVQCSASSAVREVLRINLHRYLKHMDEPLKTVRRLTSTGQIETVTQPRVYHLYACMFVQEEDIRTYRIVLDKGGIIRCERV